MSHLMSRDIFIDMIWKVVISKDNKFIYSCAFDNTIKVSTFQKNDKLYHFKNAHRGTNLSLFTLFNLNRYNKSTRLESR